MVEFKLENMDKHDKKREELFGKVLAIKEIVSYQDRPDSRPRRGQGGASLSAPSTTKNNDMM